MHIGLVGLGKMGGNMRTRMRKAGLTVIGFDRDPDLSDVGSLAELVEQLPSPRVVWVMVPAGGPTQQTVSELGELLGEGDVVVDGGNSRWTDDEKHAAELDAKGVGFVDCGVSGGVWGLENGYALMAGGDADDIAKVQPAFDALRPEGESGFVHAGRVGAGHFSKMVHNGIEYAMMQAYAEGYELLETGGEPHGYIRDRWLRVDRDAARPRQLDDRERRSARANAPVSAQPDHGMRGRERLLRRLPCRVRRRPRIRPA